jgi:hypothetical protein
VILTDKLRMKTMKRIVLIVLLMLNAFGISSAFAQTGTPVVARRSPFVEDPANAPKVQPVKVEKDGITTKQVGTEVVMPATQTQRIVSPPTGNKKKLKK